MPNFSNTQRHWIMAYDIAEPRVRRRVAGYLEGHAIRVQKSVFATTCTQHQAVALLNAIDPMLAFGDKFVMWPVIARNCCTPPKSAKANAPSVPGYWIV